MKHNILDQSLQRIQSHIPLGSTVAVGMSGGVDSSVTAALLKELGYDVIGLLMRNWEEDDHCSIEQDAQDVAIVAKTLNIPFYTLSFAREYYNEVFKKFIDDLNKGLTPNPDILCNKEIKFHRLLERSRKFDAVALATGHYAAIRYDKNFFFLERAHDTQKDQTYFLYTATQTTLSQTLFPLANFEKAEVRKIASYLNLPVATKKDSTGICFIGERRFSEFIRPYIGYSPGPIKSVEGKELGSHEGLAYYTIGQRKGLRIGGSGDAWFVAEKNLSSNTLIVAQSNNHPSLFSKQLYIDNIHWITKEPSLPLRCSAQIRYRQKDQPCTLDDQGIVTFNSPQRAITPGQAIVFYTGQTCLGGGTIRERI